MGKYKQDEQWDESNCIVVLEQSIESSRWSVNNLSNLIMSVVSSHHNKGWKHTFLLSKMETLTSREASLMNDSIAAIETLKLFKADLSDSSF